MKQRKVIAVITDALGERVVVHADAFQHALMRHFPLLPKEIILELIELVLRDPSDIFEEHKKHLFHLFYRFNSRHYIVVIVKRVDDGSFFVTAYPTGKSYRGKHRHLKRVRYEKG